MFASIRRRMSALLLAACVLNAGAAPRFEDLDTDGDGLLSSAEASALDGLYFMASDANLDDRLDPEEYAAVADPVVSAVSR